MDNHFDCTFILNTVICADTHSVGIAITVAFIQSVITKFMD